MLDVMSFDEAWEITAEILNSYQFLPPRVEAAEQFSQYMEKSFCGFTSVGLRHVAFAPVEFLEGA